MPVRLAPDPQLLVTCVQQAMFQIRNFILVPLPGPCEHLFLFPSTRICLPKNHSGLHIWGWQYLKTPFLYLNFEDIFPHLKTYKLFACFSVPASPLTQPLIMSNT